MEERRGEKDTKRPKVKAKSTGRAKGQERDEVMHVKHGTRQVLFHWCLH